MFRELLAWMASDRGSSLDEAAKDLGAGRAEIEAMLDHLRGLGYVDELSLPSACSACGKRGGCAGCSGCLKGAGNRLWALSAKGRRALAEEG